MNTIPTIKKGSGSDQHADQPEHKEVDILIDRFLEYKSITKGLISYYEDLARLETHTASELINIGGHMPVPLREGDQFLPEGGWQSILYDTREQTRAMADLHTTFAHTITHSVLHTLNHVKNDIKIFITDLETEPRRLASEVGTHRGESTRLLSQLAQGIANSKSNPHALAAKDDPVLIHRRVEAQLKDQLNFENSLTRMIIEYQKKAFEVEKRVNIDIQTAVKEFEAARIKSQGGANQHWQAIHTRITQLGPELEWNEYANRSGHLIPESITMRDAAKIAFPGQNDETTKPVKVGFLERKKRYTKNYREGYYVLSPSGYLHEHKSSDPAKHGEPEMSIFLPNCSIGAPAREGSKTFKWHIEGDRSSSGGAHISSLKKVKNSLRIGRKDIAFSFKARTYAEMQQWWEVLQHPAKASYTQATVRSSLPAGAAVSAVTEVGLDHTSDQHESPPTVTRRVAESSDEESGGSSDEEETAHSHGQLSTAPTTPAALHHDHHPLISPDGGSEGLPVYKGGDHPEAAIANLKEKPVLPPVQDVPQ